MSQKKGASLTVRKYWIQDEEYARLSRSTMDYFNNDMPVVEDKPDTNRVTTAILNTSTGEELTDSMLINSTDVWVSKK